MPSEAKVEAGSGRDSGGEALSKARPACPVCGGHLLEIRTKLQCERCHRICETCCEGSCG